MRRSAGIMRLLLYVVLILTVILVYAVTFKLGTDVMHNHGYPEPETWYVGDLPIITWFSPH